MTGIIGILKEGNAQLTKQEGTSLNTTRYLTIYQSTLSNEIISNKATIPHILGEKYSHLKLLQYMTGKVILTSPPEDQWIRIQRNIKYNISFCLSLCFCHLTIPKVFVLLKPIWFKPRTQPHYITFCPMLRNSNHCLTSNPVLKHLVTRSIIYRGYILLNNNDVNIGMRQGEEEVTSHCTLLVTSRIDD